MEIVSACAGAKLLWSPARGSGEKSCIAPHAKPPHRGVPFRINYFTLGARLFFRRCRCRIGNMVSRVPGTLGLTGCSSGFLARPFSFSCLAVFRGSTLFVNVIFHPLGRWADPGQFGSSDQKRIAPSKQKARRRKPPSEPGMPGCSKSPRL